MNYSYKKEVSMSFDDAVEKIKEELAKEGFGILTEIDVKKTMKEKLDLDYSNYIILGACNPALANKALLSEKEIGLFLPCNVIVYEDSGKVFISAILPTVAMNMIDNASLIDIAKEAEDKFKKVFDEIEGHMENKEDTGEEKMSCCH